MLSFVPLLVRTLAQIIAYTRHEADLTQAYYAQAGRAGARRNRGRRRGRGGDRGAGVDDEGILADEGRARLAHREGEGRQGQLVTCSSIVRPCRRAHVRRPCSLPRLLVTLAPISRMVSRYAALYALCWFGGGGAPRCSSAWTTSKRGKTRSEYHTTRPLSHMKLHERTPSRFQSSCGQMSKFDVHVIIEEHVENVTVILHISCLLEGSSCLSSIQKNISPLHPPHLLP